jgi:hypothetical protein
MSPHLEVVRVCDRPDALGELEAAVAGAFPRFFLFDAVWNEVFPKVMESFPDLQLMVLADGQAAGMLNSVAFAWDGTAEGLPQGEHDVMVRSTAEHAAGIAPNTLCGIQAVLLPQFIGTGFINDFIAATARAVTGFDHVISAIRPTLKEQYATFSIEEYLAWLTPSGEVFDPWIRVQQRRGASTLGVCHDSIVMTGTVAQWEDWCEMAFPASGSYAIRGGQSPLVIDRDADFGRYSEAHLWMQMPSRPQ